MEWMHNLGRAFDCFLSLLVGRPHEPNFDKSSRETCESLGVFPEVWTSQTVYLSQVNHYYPHFTRNVPPSLMSQTRTRMLAALTVDEIASASPTRCRGLLRMCGIVPEKGTRVAQLREQVTTLSDTATRHGRLPVIGALNPLPWRLTRRAQEVVNARVMGISYPHDVPTCSCELGSFIKRVGCWRTASKLLVCHPFPSNPSLHVYT
jgi:hypothetical protein